MQSVNDDYNNIVDDFDEIDDLLNPGGGWTVYGRVKIGLIHYFSLLGNDIKEPGDNKVLSRYITTRVLYLQPSNKDYLDLSIINGSSLDNIKFDFSTL